MKSLHRRSIAIISLTASSFCALVPALASARSATPAPLDSPDSAPAVGAGVDAAATGASFAGSASDYLRTHPNDTRVNTSGAAGPTAPGSTPATTPAAPAPKSGNILDKVFSFLDEVMGYVRHLLAIVTEINQLTHWFDGILGAGNAGLGGANGPMGGPAGTGSSSGIGGSLGSSAGNVSVGTNVGRNTPTTAPSGHNVSTVSHVGTSVNSTPTSLGGHGAGVVRNNHSLTGVRN